jgi:hypothetical protein
MRAALTVIAILLILGLLATTALGLLSFFQSEAVERTTERIGSAIANGIAELCWFGAFGGFILLVAIGAGYFAAKAGQGLRDGAQPAASAIAMLIVAPAIRERIEKGVPVEMPEGWSLGMPNRARWLPGPESRPQITVGRYGDE